MNHYKEHKNYVYIIREQGTEDNYVKIGVSNNPNLRLKQIDVGHRKLELIVTYEANEREHAFKLENIIHQVLHVFRQKGEWFCLRNDELRTLDDMIMTFFNIENVDYVNKSYFIQPSALDELLNEAKINIK